MKERLAGIGRSVTVLVGSLLLAGVPFYLWREHEDKQLVAQGERYEWYHVVETTSDRDADPGSLLSIKIVSGPFVTKEACREDVTHRSATGWLAEPGETGDACEQYFPRDAAKVDRWDRK